MERLAHRARTPVDEGIFSVVRYSHELGQSWLTKYGVVGSVEVSDVEVNMLDAVVAYRAELYWYGDLSKQFGGPTRYHTPKGGVRGCEIC